MWGVQFWQTWAFSFGLIWSIEEAHRGGCRAPNPAGSQHDTHTPGRTQKPLVLWLLDAIKTCITEPLPIRGNDPVWAFNDPPLWEPLVYRIATRSGNWLHHYLVVPNLWVMAPWGAAETSQGDHKNPLKNPATLYNVQDSSPNEELQPSSSREPPVKNVLKPLSLTSCFQKFLLCTVPLITVKRMRVLGGVDRKKMAPHSWW